MKQPDPPSPAPLEPAGAASGGVKAARAERVEMTDAMREGIDECRRGNWKTGLPSLARIAEEQERTGALPALVYSYLGYGVALRQQRVQEGLRLCQHAVKLEFYQAEAYINLARTLLLGNQRRAAVRAVGDGLQVEPDNVELLDLKREIGVRKSPVLPFLDRTNPVNMLLGRIRHGLRRSPRDPDGSR